MKNFTVTVETQTDLDSLHYFLDDLGLDIETLYARDYQIEEVVLGLDEKHYVSFMVGGA